jgi:hypothetical protein
MADNVKEELSVAPPMDELVLGQGAERNTAEHKGPGVDEFTGYKSP